MQQTHADETSTAAETSDAQLAQAEEAARELAGQVKELNEASVAATQASIQAAQELAASKEQVAALQVQLAAVAEAAQAGMTQSCAEMEAAVSQLAVLKENVTANDQASTEANSALAQVQEQLSTAARELELSQSEPSQTRELLQASQASQKAQLLQLEQYGVPTAT